MCGIVGVVSQTPVNQLIYDSLLLLQHRGQDAAGIATANGNNFHMHKANGMVRDVFRTRNMRSLPGNVGIGQVRYPTAGSASSEEEAQPFYVNAPFGIILAHNGNLTNWPQLKEEMFRIDRRHINTASDTEVLLNVFAHELQLSSSGLQLDPTALFKAVSGVHRRVKGSYWSLSAIRSASVRWCSASRKRRPAWNGWWRRNRWPLKVSASNSCATWSRAKRFSSITTATCTVSNVPRTRA